MIEPALRVVHIAVKPDRIIAQVEVVDERCAYTTSALIASLLPDYPHLLEHACVNDRGDTFAAVASSTSTPHLLEHMAIENQVRLEGERAQMGGDVFVPGVTYMGKTQWENRARRRARVELSYADDLVALQALRDAARDLNKAIALLDARGSLPASRGKTMQ